MPGIFLAIMFSGERQVLSSHLSWWLLYHRPMLSLHSSPFVHVQIQNTSQLEVTSPPKVWCLQSGIHQPCQLLSQVLTCTYQSYPLYSHFSGQSSSLVSHGIFAQYLAHSRCTIHSQRAVCLEDYFKPLTPLKQKQNITKTRGLPPFSCLRALFPSNMFKQLSPAHKISKYGL